MTDPARVNGNLYSWPSITCVVDGEVITGFTEITFGDKRERVQGYGLGSHYGPLGRSAGKYSTEEISLKGYKHATAALRERLALKSADGRSYGSVEFQIEVYYTEQDLGSHDVRITGCVIVGENSSNTESSDPLQDELKIQAMYIYRDGLTLFDSSQITPV
jgi:hypothetical protein